MRANNSDDLALLDRPEVLSRMFYPRKELPEIPITLKAMTHFIEVEEGISIGCRFYPAHRDAANVLFFHGNGETASDYDYIAPLYNERGMNLYVADYRGYGLSNGRPTATALVKDAYALFQGCITFLKELGYGGDVFIMGRSLGSVPAIESVVHYPHRLKGLIIESGFSNTFRLINYLGFGHLFPGITDLKGFGNDDKIKDIFIPLLVMHGKKDRLIPFAEGKELYELSGSTQKRLVLLPHADHNNLLFVARKLYFHELETFVKEVGNQWLRVER